MNRIKAILDRAEAIASDEPMRNTVEFGAKSPAEVVARAQELVEAAYTLYLDRCSFYGHAITLTVDDIKGYAMEPADLRAKILFNISRNLPEKRGLRIALVAVEETFGTFI